MREVTEFPEKITEEHHLPITARDGTTLSVRIWRPIDAQDSPVPGILEAIPYRKRDLMAHRDSIHQPYLAGHGFACVRLDLRGTGDSEGVLTDEYTETEHRDIEDVLAWLAEQPWCSGRTGMLGISWGAFTALQVAARRPPSLGAIVLSSFTDDRYADDMHYMGGCLLSDNLAEAGTMFAHATCPPDPDVVGDRWRQLWLERLEQTGPWIDEWLSHQRRDEYWRRASVCEDYSAVEVPVLASSGWADGYSNAVFRVLEHLEVPRRGLIGPWSHRYPHLGAPGPAVGYLQEVVRWFDHWLRPRAERPEPAGLLAGPMLVAWMQDSVPPSTAYDDRPGRWVGEPTWPSPTIEPVRHALDAHRICPAGETPEVRDLVVQSPLSVGQFAGKWASYNAPPDLPYDQREEDGGSLVFDTDELTERQEILGAPVAELDLAASEPVAMVAVRLSDVAPDGAATRVTYGLLNLTRRDGQEVPEPLEPGRYYRVRIPLNGVAQAFSPGHRIRLSVSTSYWPLAWPPPRPVQLRVRTATSTVTLPIRPTTDEPAIEPFGDVEGARPIPLEQVTEGDHRWTVSRDLVDYRSALEIVKDAGTVHFPDIGLDVARRAYEHYSWVADDFTSARGETRWTMHFRRGDWDSRTETRTVLTCTETDFHLRAELDGYDRGERVVSRNWHHVIPRDCL
jgi:putative CocE/NonD family hydrolase